VKYLVAIAGLAFIFASCGGDNKGKLADDKTLFEKGQTAFSSQQYSVAIENFTLLAKNYPKSEYRYKALFLSGFIQYEFLKNNKEAARFLTQLIEEYPESDLADDAIRMRDAANSGRDLMSIIEDSLKTK
jgi:outer membrane protein assembly factor BamD (BamD/ComL family)